MKKGYEFMEDNNRKQDKRVVYALLSLATVLLAVVGVTFAYWTTTLDDNTEQSIDISTGNPIGLSYEEEDSNSRMLFQGILQPETLMVHLR